MLLLLTALPLCAQSPAGTEVQMNEIKLNESMVYGEGFSENKEIAYDNALNELMIFANEYRAKKGQQAIGVSDLLTVVKELVCKNGAQYTVMVYMPMTQMLAITPKSNSDIVAQLIPGQKQEAAATVAAEAAPAPAAETAVFRPTPAADEILRKLCPQDNWLEIKGFMIDFKQSGKITSVGNVISYAEVPDDAYAILMDEMGGILAILSPKGGARQVNCRTRKIDAASNYSNCKYIFWYK